MIRYYYWGLHPGEKEIAYFKYDDELVLTETIGILVNENYKTTHNILTREQSEQFEAFRVRKKDVLQEITKELWELQLLITYGFI